MGWRRSVTEAPRPLPGGLSATLALVRHGHSTWIEEGRFQGRGDPPLSASGERQALALAARLAVGGRLDPLPTNAPLALWSSPLQRARATAARLAGVPGWPPVRLEPGLLEIGQGAWEGQLAAEVARRWPGELAAWRRDPAVHHAPGGEAVVDAAGRARAALERIVADLAAAAGAAGPAIARSPVPGYGGPPTDQPWAVVVAHDGVLRLVLLALLELPLTAYWRFPFVLCGLTVVEIGPGGAMLRAHDLAEHLVDAVDGVAATNRPGAL
jgi:broad specificity phosphatase PhoE